MTVYVETNFVLELALGQEQADSCREIFHLAESDNLVLAIPAYSLMEPYEKLIRDAQRRQSLANELDRSLPSLGVQKRSRQKSVHSKSSQLSLQGGENRN